MRREHGERKTKGEKAKNERTITRLTYESILLSCLLLLLLEQG